MLFLHMCSFIHFNTWVTILYNGYWRISRATEIPITMYSIIQCRGSIYNVHMYGDSRIVGVAEYTTIKISLAR